MDPEIASRFHDGLLQQAMERYAITSESIQKLDGFESFIYQFERPDGRYILRIGHSSRRSPDLIRGEVDWINYLARGGASVARAILSERGHLVEPLDDLHGGQFLCTGFVHAPGGAITRERFTDGLIHNYGRLLGRMHSLAKRYTVTNPAWKRYDWDAPENNITEKQMPAQERIALEKYLEVMAHLRTLPRTPDGFGMIHQDAHHGNFFVNGDDELTLFDFDDCVYGHFIYDIAMVLFYTSDGAPDSIAFIEHFMPVFLAGYRTENQLDPHWLKELPHFMKLREIDLFATIHFSYEDGDNPDHPWCARYMQGRRSKIENDVPYLDYDWDSLAEYL
jgi:amicoumacin kinase